MDNVWGQTARSFREERGLTLRDVATRIGWSHSTLAKKETGESRITEQDLRKLVAALNVSMEEFANRANQFAEARPTVNAGTITPELESRSSYVTIKGDSMSPYFNPGDVIHVRQAQWGEQPVPGEPVIAYLYPESGHEGEAMFMWLPLSTGLVRLGKANDHYPAIEVRPEHIGRLLRVVRVISRASHN